MPVYQEAVSKEPRDFSLQKGISYPTGITVNHRFFFGKSFKFICENLCDLRENDL
jgi:hypothetical protein